MYGFEAELRRVVHDKCRDAVPDTLRQRIADAIHHEHDAEAEGSQASESHAGGGQPSAAGDTRVEER
jgi:hypothetical protein